MDDKDAMIRDFAARLQKAMVDKGWSQSELARAATMYMPKGKEFGRHLINYYLRLRGLPTPVYLKALSSALGVSPNNLLAPRETWADRDFVGVSLKTVPENPDEVWLEFKQRMAMSKALKIMDVLRE